MKFGSLTLVSALIFSLLSLIYPNLAESQDLQLPLKVERYTSTMSEVNVRSYIKNIEHYRGLRLVAIEVEAAALNESATTIVIINDLRQGPVLQLGSSVRKFMILPEAEFFMGQGAEEIILSTPEPAYIKNIVLVLSRQ